jgi:hypothetical protein
MVSLRHLRQDQNVEVEAEEGAGSLMNKSLRQRGQAAVETAIVMPLNLFMILGIIQWGLLGEARILAKYAAYRAVRVGVMNSADPDKMRDAATLALLPVMAMPDFALGGVRNVNLKRKTDGISEFYPQKIDLTTALAGRVINSIPMPLWGWPMVKVVICGPLKRDLTKASEFFLTGAGSDKQVDFDDPRVTQTRDGDYYGASYSKGDQTSSATLPGSAQKAQEGYVKYLSTKLRIQVQFKYHMPIPFANYLMSNALLGAAVIEQIPDVMRMPSNQIHLTGDFLELLAAYKAGVYIAPINVSYAMRMQSNFYTQKLPLPDKNTCVHYPGSNWDD